MESNEIARTILRTLESGWNQADGYEFATPFAATSEFVDITGTLHQNASTQYIAEAHKHLLKSIYQDSKVAYELVQAVEIDQHTILANAQATLDVPAGPLAGKNASTITLVITQSDDHWKIRAFQNTLVRNR